MDNTPQRNSNKLAECVTLRTLVGRVIARPMDGDIPVHWFSYIDLTSMETC